MVLSYLCTAKPQNGTLAEWLGNGLQNRVQQFDSARYLRRKPAISGLISFSAGNTSSGCGCHEFDRFFAGYVFDVNPQN